MAYDYYDYDPAMEPYKEAPEDFLYCDINGKPIHEGDIVRGYTQTNGIIRGKVRIAFKSDGRPSYLVQSNSSIGWRVPLDKLRHVERFC